MSPLHTPEREFRGIGCSIAAHDNLSVSKRRSCSTRLERTYAEVVYQFNIGKSLGLGLEAIGDLPVERARSPRLPRYAYRYGNPVKSLHLSPSLYLCCG